MMRKNLIRTTIAFTLLMIGGLTLIKGKSAREAGDSELASTGNALEKKNGNGLPSRETLGSKPEQTVDASAVGVSQPAPAVQRVDPLATYQHAKSLSEFSQIKAKVFMTDADKAARARMLKDERMLRDLSKLLTQPALRASQGESMQNSAIDLLLEAREAGSQAAAEAMRTVITDRQVENESLPREARQALAGVKAEIIYEWTAREPARANDMSSWLPGPVSRKLWQNAQAAQRQNALESAREQIR